MRSTTSHEDNDFLVAMDLDHKTLLERAADYIADNFPSEDVYDVQKLRDWAIDNGFVEESEA